MNEKFKVGDKVRVVRVNTKAKERYVGKEFEIKGLNPNGFKEPHYSIGEVCIVYEDELERVFTKADLKDGMVVEHRDGKRHLVLGERLIGVRTWRYIRDVHDDLNDTTESLAIDKVYQTKGYNLQNLFDNNQIVLIWERTEPIKEMTIEEIEKELGYKIKIIGDK